MSCNIGLDFHANQLVQATKARLPPTSELPLLHSAPLSKRRLLPQCCPGQLHPYSAPSLPATIAMGLRICLAALLLVASAQALPSLDTDLLLRVRRCGIKLYVVR